MEFSNKSNNLNDQREHPRKLYLKEVMIIFDNQSFKGMIQNMSKSGVYIECNKKFDVGYKITISYMTNDDKSKVEIPGEIVWNDDNGFAMKYI